MSIILGFIGIASGILLVVKTDWFLEYFGSIAWAENHLGTEGGTRMFYKLVGIGMIVLSFLLMTGTIQSWLAIIFSFGKRR